ncbi:MAG: DNA alkylation repair protein [Candidatus Limnocylindrales bacterium]
MSEGSAFVAVHLDEATALGERLTELIDRPGDFLAQLTEGLLALREPEYLAMATRACPQTPARYLLRGPLAEAVNRPLRQALREGSSMSALQLAQVLAAADHRDLRLHAHEPLRRALPEDPEMAWQIMRRLGRAAEDWIATDSLADLWARGILAEAFRWAELEQLLYSGQVYERRLVAATLATLPHRLPKERRGELREHALERALELVRQLMGDAEVMVQKALSWAIREWTPVDAEATGDLLRAETTLAAEGRDGARAWVIRDSLSKQPADLADELRARLEGIRRVAGAPSTSIASTQAAAFAEVLGASTDVAAAQGDRYTRSHA